MTVVQENTRRKDTPLLMCREMVLATLSGQKTNTRRIVRPQPINRSFRSDGFRMWVESRRAIDGHMYQVVCPYGDVGDRLWVRERFYPHDGYITYWADCIPERVTALRWKPSIHMPRAASRITLEITRITIERVQEISEEDARAEGVRDRSEFEALWETLNGPRGFGWDANPWVWSIHFKRTEAT